MPKEKKDTLCVESLRHAEYYGMQKIFDELYEKSLNGQSFENLMDIVLMRENILLAYRTIKNNTGSKTAGTDGLTIQDIENLTADEVIDKVRFIVSGSPHGYRPKPVRRKEIPKHNGGVRPLGIPCIWDRLIQQCIKQVMEPICEAKFSNHSYGFRPNRSVENAIAETYMRLQRNNLHYVVEFDIKGFFDNVNHPKLKRQIWAMGFHDKQLLYVIGKILMAPIKMQNGLIEIPTKGTPQGGIISPLLANIVLNELDHWVESNWENHPVTQKYYIGINSNGSVNKGTGYEAMRGTNLKEMWITRYADDFRIFCRTKSDAEKVKIAVTNWLKERLKLDVSAEKTKVVNVKRKNSEFLGFQIKVHPKGQKYRVISHVNKKQLKQKEKMLVEQAKRIATPRPEKGEYGEVQLYNAMVMGVQNYYNLATDITNDFSYINRHIMCVLTNRLTRDRNCRLLKNGRKLTTVESKLYGRSSMVRYLSETKEPIYPIGFVQHKNPMSKKRAICCYTEVGRSLVHQNLRINTSLLLQLMREPLHDRSIEYADNRISLFSAQHGKCAVTGQKFMNTSEIHCHHIVPRNIGGTDAYENLVLINSIVHKLVHAKTQEVIEKYRNLLSLDKRQMEKVNKLRLKVGLTAI